MWHQKYGCAHCVTIEECKFVITLAEQYFIHMLNMKILLHVY